MVGLPNTAAGIRIYNNAKILRDLGYSVDFVCDLEDDDGQTIQQYDGFNYYFKENTISNRYIRSLNIIRELISAEKTLMRIKKYCEVEKPLAIILYNDPYSLTKKLIPYCNKLNIKLICDVTEWYETTKLIELAAWIKSYLTNKRITKLDKKVHNIIAISPFFYNYYNRLGCNTLMLPPVFDVQKDIIIDKHDYYEYRVLNLVYAGSPGAKDILVPVLDAVQEVNRQTHQIRFDLVGVNYEYLKKVWKNVNFEEIGIIAHGVLPHKNALKIVQKADFGVLFPF